MAFNRDRNSRGGDRGGFRSRPSFGGRQGGRSSFGGGRGPVEMHEAVCDNCGKTCQVPFRPTSGKPVFCSDCFEKNGSSEPRRSNSNEREMFEAICDNCGKDCKIPFRPSGGRPVYCSDCFEKGNNESRGNNSRNSDQPQGREQSNNYDEQFKALNAKLDSILRILEPVATDIVTEEVVVDQPAAEEPTPVPTHPADGSKAAKKRKSSKKPESPTVE